VAYSNEATPVGVRGSQAISGAAAGVASRPGAERCRNRRSTSVAMRSCREALFASRTGVHVDFHAHRHFDNFRSLPSHFSSPSRTERQIAVGEKDRTTPQTVQAGILHAQCCEQRFQPKRTDLRRNTTKAMVIRDWLSLVAKHRHLNLHLVSGRSRPSVSSADT
jgi:hypothetical protein